VSQRAEIAINSKATAQLCVHLESQQTEVMSSYGGSHALIIITTIGEQCRFCLSKPHIHFLHYQTLSTTRFIPMVKNLKTNPDYPMCLRGIIRSKGKGIVIVIRCAATQET
jgi:hypothetical protein